MANVSQNPSAENLTDKIREDVLLEGHAYDGIQEYDNDLPLWWTVIFVMSIFWAVLYFVGITFTKNIPTYEEGLARENIKINAVRSAAMAKMPKLTPASLNTLLKDESLVATGNGVYATTCASCHGAKGEGGIGANLADMYWIHGAQPMNIYDTISKGVVEKGMPSWESSLSLESRVALVAFIQSLEGTNPANPKAPQGVKVEG